MNSFTIFPRILLMLTVLSMIHYTSPLDCSPSLGNIKCECTATTVECSGSQADLFEVEEILKNFSRTETVTFKIKNLQFDSSFILEDSDIKNLTLGYTQYGLQVLSSNFFSKLSSSLVSLNLQNNSITNIDDYFFSNFSLLTELFIDNNGIENLTSNTFIDLNNLKYLSLSYNNISDIISEVFQHLISLETVILSHNTFSLIENINIKSATLTELKIDNCLIEGLIHKNTLENIPNTEKLDMSRNKLSGIESHSLSSLKKLKYLNLSYNVIEYLEENAFSDIANLAILDLQGNRISVIKLSSFEKLQNLIYLDLSGNKLKAVLCEYTTDFTSLERIYLQNNDIKTFTPGAFFYSPKLKIMDMTGNNLECSCPLTESAHYLIENGTMERADLESVSCVILSTGSQLPITKYESSKCIPVEPCKRIEVTDENEYDYDYENPIILTSTTDVSIKSKMDTTTASVTDTSVTPTTDSSTKAITDTSTTTTTDSSTKAITDTSTTTTTDASTTYFLSTEKHSAEVFTTFLPTTQSILNETETDSTLKPLITTEYNKLKTTTISTDSEDTMSTQTATTNNTANAMPLDTNSDITTVPFITTTREINTESISENSSEEPNTTRAVSTKIIIATTPTVQTTEKLTVSSTTAARKTIIPGAESNCSSLQLSFSDANLSTDLTIYKNFSNRNVFCLKWTAGGIKDLKIRCSIKYTTTAGTKVLNLQCPSAPYEIKDWTRNEKIFKFCIIIYPEGKRKQDSCELLISDKSTSTLGKTHTTTATTITTAFIASTESTTKTTTKSTTKTTAESTLASVTVLNETTADITSTLLDKITTSFNKPPTNTTLTSHKINTDIKFTTSTTVSSVILYPTDFELTKLNLYFNDSKLAFTTWTVNKWQPLSVCNLTLKVSTQYFDEIEGVFPCKNDTYKLTKVKEDDIFKVCLFSYHAMSGKDNLCEHTLPSAKAATSKDESLNSSLIPLICLLILVGLIILFVVLKNISKRRSVSKKYDVRAEEEKYQERAKLRPQSVHEESVRFSYIANENHEYM